MYKQITHVELDMLRERQEVVIVDVRDEVSYQKSHIPNALHLSMDTLSQFIASADKTLPTIVYCYHGVTSQSVAQLLVESGFEAIYSLVGGFECWENDKTRSKKGKS